MKTFKRIIFTVEDEFLKVEVEHCFENGKVIKSHTYTTTRSSRWRLTSLSHRSETYVTFYEHSMVVAIIGKLR